MKEQPKVTHPSVIEEHADGGAGFERKRRRRRRRVPVAPAALVQRNGCEVNGAEPWHRLTCAFVLVVAGFFIVLAPLALLARRNVAIDGACAYFAAIWPASDCLASSRPSRRHPSVRSIACCNVSVSDQSRAKSSFNDNGAARYIHGLRGATAWGLGAASPVVFVNVPVSMKIQA